MTWPIPTIRSSGRAPMSTGLAPIHAAQRDAEGAHVDHFVRTLPGRLRHRDRR
jgi:hypothetical protein